MYISKFSEICNTSWIDSCLILSFKETLQVTFTNDVFLITTGVFFEVVSPSSHVSRKGFQARKRLPSHGYNLIRGEYKSPLTVAFRAELYTVGMYYS